MRLSRRMFVKAGAAATAIGVTGIAGATEPLVIYDNRIAQSRVYALRQRGVKLDLAREHGRWPSLRAALPDRPITGLVRWSDYVLVRGFAEDQRRRVRSEKKLGNLIAFEIG
jgi:hypothetical protein